MCAQSGEPGVETARADAAEKEQVTQFADEEAGWAVDIGHGTDSTMEVGHNLDASIATFLNRPIRQSAQSWLVGQPFFYSFNPWNAFCTNSAVRDKIKNYKLLKMNLHVKFVVSGTKFHYGRVLVSYNPFIKNDQVTVQRNFINQDLIAASQKPHGFLNPTMNAGTELHLPFFWDDNYFDIPTGTWSGAGNITMKSFQSLQHANAGNEPVTISIFIWATDVVLTVPTSADPPLLAQSGRPSMKMGAQDEYGNGIISAPMSALASFAGNFVNLPKVGPYAMATQIGANATSSMAKLFGMSRPNIITNIIQTKPLPAGNLANTDAHDGAMKLTLDSKAEVTVDSRVAGLDGTDQMDIVQYCGRESYLTQFSWDGTLPVDTLLWNTRVTPMMLDVVAATGEIHMTPIAHMSAVFEQWRGSLKFRFQVVKCDFHKGRLLIRWDPKGVGSTVNYNTVYSRAIDISELDDFEIIVGWGQENPWKECGTPQEAGGTLFSTASRLTSIFATDNGVLDISVLNELVSPALDKPVFINVFVSACDDYKLAGPTNAKIVDLHLFNDTVVLQAQSSLGHDGAGPVDPSAAAASMQMAKSGEAKDATYMVFYGDPPTSIRDLCKRYCRTRVWAPVNVAPGSIRQTKLINKNLPYFTGYDPQGIETNVAGTRSLTLGPTAYHSWFLPCYAGYRGAMRKKYLFTAVSGTPSVTRLPYNGSTNATYTTTTTVTSSLRLGSVLSATGNINSGNGTASTNIDINNTLEVELPFYWPNRFASSRMIRAQDLRSNSHEVNTTTSTTGAINNQQVMYQQYDAVGEDFTLLFFTGVPIYYQYSLTDLT